MADISKSIGKIRSNYRYQDIYGFLSDLRINNCTKSNILQFSLYEMLLFPYNRSFKFTLVFKLLDERTCSKVSSIVALG